jgi:hypothetical protein
MQRQIEKANNNAKESLSFHDRISNEKIINAAFILLNHTFTFKLFKTELYRRIGRQFSLVFVFVRQRNSDLEKRDFRKMLMLLDSARENL